MGRGDRGLRAGSRLDAGRRASPGDWRLRIYARAGEHAKALVLLEKMKGLVQELYIDPYNFAFLYDGLGDIDHAMESLQRAYEERSPSLPGMWCEPFSARLRADPRFQDLLRRMKFPVK